MNKKKWVCALGCATILSIALGTAFSVTNISSSADGNAVRTSMCVATPDDWAESTKDGKFTVSFSETEFSVGEYLAIDLRVTASYLDGTPNMYTPKLKINGEDVLDEDGKNFRFYNRNGNPYNVEYKFGGYLFLPKDANGIVYIPAEDLLTENGQKSEVYSLSFEFTNHARSGEASYYSIFKASEFAEQASEENVIFDFSKVGTDTDGTVTDAAISSQELVLSAKPSENPGYARYKNTTFTVTTPTDNFQNTYFTATFPETEFTTGDYLAIDLKVESAAFSGSASSNYAFQLKLNGATLQQPKGVYKQTFGAEFGTYQRGGSGVGFFGNGVWFFMNADLDAILYIPAEKLLTGTSSSDAVLQTKISSLTIDYAGGNVGRQTTVAYNGIFKATKVGETMNADNCMYDFTQVSTDENGAINDSTLTVSRLTAAVTKTSENRFVADMVHDYDGETTYVSAENNDEYTLRVSGKNTLLYGVDALRLRVFASRATENATSFKLAVKIKGEETPYTLLNGAEIPFMTMDAVDDLMVKNGAISLTVGADGTIYIPLRFLTQNGSAYFADSVADKLTKETELEYIEVVYAGGDCALSEIALFKESGGANYQKTLGAYSLSNGQANVLENGYDKVELYVNGKKAIEKDGKIEISIFGSTFSISNKLGFFASTKLNVSLRDGVKITSLQTDILGANGEYTAEWLTKDGVLALQGRPFDCELALTEQTVVVSVTVEGNRSVLVAPEKTVKSVNDETPFTFNMDTEYGENTPINVEWKVDGETKGEGKTFLFAPTEAGVYIVELYVNDAFIDSRTVTVIDGEIKEFADGQIIGEEYVTATNGGFYVSTPGNWSSQDAYFKVDFPQTSVEDKYLAVDLKVAGIQYGPSILSSQHQYTVKFGINGGVLSQREASIIQQFSGVKRAGTSVDVDFKFGNWFFVPENFDGVIYIPAEDLFGANGLQTELSSFTVDYTNGNTGKTSTVYYRYVYLADEIGDPVSQENVLIDFCALQADENGKIIDESFVHSGDLIVKNTTKTSSYWTAEIIELDDSYEGTLKMGVKSEALGGVAVQGTYDFGWATVKLDAFTPHDGLALQVYAPSGECYFKIVLEDENGCFWKVDISDLPQGINPDSFSITYKEERGEIKGAYGCFYLPNKKIGTLYIPYTKFIPLTDGADFKGDSLVKGESMGKIVGVHFGLDMVYGLGRTLAIGTGADVSLENCELRYLFATRDYTEAELNLGKPSLGGTFKSTCTAAHENNWAWSRLIDRELPGYVNKDALNALIAFCAKLDKTEYTEDSWSTFYGKFVVAKSTAENPFATQDDVNDATSALSLAKFNLQLLSELKNENSSSGCGAVVSCGWIIPVLMGMALCMKKRRMQ